jgi:Spy/CpxP family protein refolding chaperone
MMLKRLSPLLVSTTPLLRGGRAVVVIGALALAGLGGCASAATGETQPVTSDTAATRAPVGQNTHGFVRLVGDALGEVALRPAQRAEIEKLAADAEARHAAGKAARADLTKAIADQVAKGAIDRAALQPKIDATMEKTQPADRAALERLHAILDPDQRTAFVEALQKKMQQHKDAKGEHHVRGDHGGSLMSIAKDLNLTSDQKDKLHSAMRDQWKEMRTHHKGGGDKPQHHARMNGKKVLEAFKTPDFKLDTVAPAHDIKAGATKMTERMLKMAETAIPILTPEQRNIAAQKLRERADKPDMGHGF